MPDEPLRDARITIYGDFSCPWSYLAWRRSEVLAADGVEVDWRAVEHEPWHQVGAADRAARHEALHAEVRDVEGRLLPGERLPHVFNGFVPFTGAATAAYAEAAVAGVPEQARKALFEAFWLHGVDLNDGRAVRSLLADAVRGRPSPSELVNLWGYTVDVTGGPVTSAGWRTVRAWREDWTRLGPPVVPTLVMDTAEPIRGRDAVDRLAAELRERGLDDFDETDAGRLAGAA